MTAAELHARLTTIIANGFGALEVSMEGCCCYSDPGDIIITPHAVELCQAACNCDCGNHEEDTDGRTPTT